MPQAKKNPHNSYGSDLEIARSVMNSAIDGIKQLSSGLGVEFTNLVNEIHKLKGRVIISGMGKSGHIGKKISATLASTGTSAYFVHPGEASHGDLGIISRNDLVILLSNSGETNELKDIVNYTKRFNITLASFVKNKNSTLGLASDITITIPNISEALDFEAPTTSSTMMLVLGDALALTLLQKRGFTADDFKIFHPGGRLGASLVKVKDLMHHNDKIPFVFEDDNMEKVLSTITSKKLGCVIVLDKKKLLAGIITDGDLRRNISSKILSLKARDIMKINPFTINENSMSVEALDLMNSKSIMTLIVTSNNANQVSGIIHMHDCLRSGASPYIKEKN